MPISSLKIAAAVAQIFDVKDANLRAAKKYFIFNEKTAVRNKKKD